MNKAQPQNSSKDFRRNPGPAELMTGLGTGPATLVGRSPCDVVLRVAPFLLSDARLMVLEDIRQHYGPDHWHRIVDREIQ